MYKVLVVEDEALVRLGLKNGVDWAKYHMEVVADLPNGKAAYEQYLAARPDIIITDINMPVMDGLELIAKIRETDPDTLFVILSCLEEFALVRKAMALGVTEYLLKLTATEDEIGALLAKLQGKLDSRGAGSAAAEGPALSLAKSKLIQNYIFYHTLGATDFAAQAQRLGLHLSPDGLELVLAEVDDYPRLKEAFEDEKGHLANFALMNILTEIVGGSGEVCHEGDARYILLLNHGGDGANTLLGRVGKAVEQTLHISMSFGTSGVQRGYGRLSAMYDEANLALQGKYFRGRGTVNRPAQPVAGKELHAALQPLYGLLAQAGIHDGQLESRYKDRVDEGIRALGADAKTAKEATKELLIGLLGYLAQQLDLFGDMAHARLISHGQVLQQHEFLSDDIRELLLFLTGLRSASQEESRRSEIAKALEYIHQNYHRDITLQEVAAHVNLSPNYFSSLFKREIGSSLTETLNSLRIQEARRLLRETGMRTYEIAEQVGYRENTYFSTLFKRMTGMSPNQYRENWKQARKGNADDCSQG